MSRLPRFLVLGALLACALPTALAAQELPPSPPPPPSAGGELTTHVGILRFSAAGRQVQATGLVTAVLTDRTSGRRTALRQRVSLQTTSGGGGCRILKLTLDELSLKLLGLNANLDRVELTVTGRRDGGVLGRLFCQLANARVDTAAQASATARTLNAELDRRRSTAIRFSAQLTPRAVEAQAGATCQVLDLVLGPLHLDLLGLVVDLNRVHLVVTATRGGGTLGDTFCALGGPAPTPAPAPATP